MGRPSEGWKVRWKRGWAYCCFTWESYEYRLALRTKDKREAQDAAARAYSEVISGQRRPVRRAPGQLLDLADLLDTWIDSKRTGIHKRTLQTIEDYARRYVDYFVSLDRITESTGAAFGAARLGQVLRTTVLRELSYLREFLRWCKLEGVLPTTPNIPRLPPKAQGRRAGKQRAKAVHISEAEAKAILALLPELSKTIDGRKWPVRDRFAFAWETTLRPGTISRLRVPDHWRPGSRELELTNEDDKARWGRTLDLSDVAVAILTRCAPDRGLIFGHHIFYKVLKAAAIEVLGPIKGRLFAPYDFRHGRAKALLDAGAPIRGVSYNLGHKRVSTTDKYLAPERSAGREALAAAGAFSHPPKRRRKKDGKN
jgi:integrase